MGFSLFFTIAAAAIQIFLSTADSAVKRGKNLCLGPNQLTLPLLFLKEFFFCAFACLGIWFYARRRRRSNVPFPTFFSARDFFCQDVRPSKCMVYDPSSKNPKRRRRKSLLFWTPTIPISYSNKDFLFLSRLQSAINNQKQNWRSLVLNLKQNCLKSERNSILVKETFSPSLSN